MPQKQAEIEATNQRDEGVGKPFNLIRRFSLMSLASIAAWSALLAVALSYLLAEEILRRDAQLTSQFVQSLAEVEGVAAYFENMGRTSTLRVSKGSTPAPAGESYTSGFFIHVSKLPDVMLASAFARDRAVVWSSNPALVGQRFPDNDELEDAFASKLVIEKGRLAADVHKPETSFLGDPGSYFVENYIPVMNRKGEVVGVVELYKRPRAMMEAIFNGFYTIWICTLAGAIFLYAVLFWVVKRAQSVMLHQQERLVNSETLVVIGEMASAVAHSIRNPLASIRSSAELAIEGDPETLREAAHDIIAESDRLSKWVRDLLTYSRPVNPHDEKVLVEDALRESIDHYRSELERRHIDLVQDSQATGCWVKGNRSLLVQAFNSILANAAEAMPQGGRLTVQTEAPKSRYLTLHFADTGAGIAPDRLPQIFKPFNTTKRNGLGLGLPMVKRVAERFGGSVEVESEPGKGTTVTLKFVQVK